MKKRIEATTLWDGIREYLKKLTPKERLLLLCELLEEDDDRTN